MNGTLSISREAPGGGVLRRGATGALLGAGFTLLLFLGLARWKTTGPDINLPEFTDLATVTAPVDPPPPPPELAPPETAAPVAEISGFEVGDTNSPVKITVAPPEIMRLLPIHAAPPSLQLMFRTLPVDLKPKLGVAPEFQRIYQQSEVDQRPQVIAESSPFIPPVVRRGASRLSVVLLFVVDTTGAVANVRIIESSGNAPFDQIIADCVKDKWLFSPAIKQGKRVKCMVQRAIIVKWTTSPFGD